MPYAYRKSERLRKNKDFTQVMKQGKRLSADGLSLFYTENGRDNFRVGISTARKLAGAVTRNRMKRQVRACITTALDDRAAGYDLVFIVRQGLLGGEFSRIQRAVREILDRAGFRGQ